MTLPNSLDMYPTFFLSFLFKKEAFCFSCVQMSTHLYYMCFLSAKEHAVLFWNQLHSFTCSCVFLFAQENICLLSIGNRVSGTEMKNVWNKWSKTHLEKLDQTSDLHRCLQRTRILRKGYCVFRITAPTANPARFYPWTSVLSFVNILQFTIFMSYMFSC